MTKARPTSSKGTTENIGHWLDSGLRNVPRGKLEWLSPPPGGLRTHVATINGEVVATIRTHVLQKNAFTAKIPGWMWAVQNDDSVASRLGIKESVVVSFSSVRAAKAAVEMAFKLLSDAEPQNNKRRK